MDSTDTNPLGPRPRALSARRPAAAGELEAQETVEPNGARPDPPPASPDGGGEAPEEPRAAAPDSGGEAAQASEDAAPDRRPPVPTGSAEPQAGGGSIEVQATEDEVVIRFPPAGKPPFPPPAPGAAAGRPGAPAARREDGRAARTAHPAPTAPPGAGRVAAPGEGGGRAAGAADRDERIAGRTARDERPATAAGRQERDAGGAPSAPPRGDQEQGGRRRRRRRRRRSDRPEAGGEPVASEEALAGSGGPEAAEAASTQDAARAARFVGGNDDFEVIAPPPEGAARAAGAEEGGHRRRRRRRRRRSHGEEALQPSAAPREAADFRRVEEDADIRRPDEDAEIERDRETVFDELERGADDERPAPQEPAPEAEPAAPIATQPSAEARGRRRGRRGGRRRRRPEEGGAATRPERAEPAPQDSAVEAPAEAAPETGEEEGELVEIEAPSAIRTLRGLPPVSKEMVINVAQREECRIAILKDGKLEEIYLERASTENHVGNIYKGRVTNVEPSIQAAFVDFGLPKNGFLHISDLHPRYFPNGGQDSEKVGHKTPRRERPPIQRCLRRGQEVIVQIIKEGIGTKGPTLSTYLSIPGRFMVMLPGMERVGVSRKVEDPELREKLRGQLAELSLPPEMGFIARTAAVDRTKRELQSDLNYLTRLWKSVEKRIETERAPAELYRESDLLIRTIRDVFTSDIERIVVDDREVAERAREFLAIFSPRSRDAVVLYDSKIPIFHHYRIEAELDRLHSRHVPLRSGGSLVFDSTEALVAIDVNSGSFREHDDAEATAYKINMEAAVEIARQLRLRDLGGVIVCDFIDMRHEKHRREVERTLIRELKAHKERAKVLRMSQFGIIEMTRQRQRASLTRSVYQDCHFCRGTGLVKTAESVALDVMRLIQLAVTREHIASIEVHVSSEVARLLQNRKRGALYELETANRRNITVLPEAGFGLDQVQMQYFDARGRPVPIN